MQLTKGLYANCMSVVCTRVSSHLSAAWFYPFSDLLSQDKHTHNVCVSNALGGKNILDVVVISLHVSSAVVHLDLNEIFLDEEAKSGSMKPSCLTEV